MSSIPLDEHGQPVTTRLRQAANHARDINELIGICRGIVFDGKVSGGEVVNLYKWLHAQPELAKVWPANVIYKRLCEVIADKVLTAAEAADLLAMFNEIVGASHNIVETIDESSGEVIANKSSTVLPVSNPETVVFEGMRFVMTGKFEFGTRAECEEAVIVRGGSCAKSPTRKTNYIVIGELGSRDWLHSSWGNKITHAVELRESGSGIEILSEQHWKVWLERVGPL